ncbi:hypothetical protein [Acidovorax sp.]|uniref:hypothetical protein n=1 Tax=Acidovorax sp. TaxID=1872122 RepID=UPI0025BB9672|nr:hypothetical protein [Acidovorax sp.]MBW8466480.1 hypothetical protein [Acidovorax sp.]
MISVEIPAPYLSLEHLVSAIAQAVARASRSSAELVNIEEAEAFAAVTWESKLRALAESRAIKGHHRESLSADEWVFLDVERDAFFVDDLNACKQLSEAGLRFVVAEDQRERAEFTAFFIEATNNDAEINWQYWIDQMPTISAGEAARLMAGLDPDLYADLRSRPVPKNNVDAACKRATNLERLATAESRTRATPDEWLEWARERQFQVHCGFEMAVEDKRAREALEAAFNALPKKEADHWRSAHPVDDGRRLVTFKLAGLESAQHFSLASFVEDVSSRIARWKDGTYAIAEAAQLMADAGSTIDAEALCEQMEAAVHAGPLKFRKNGIPLSKGDIPKGRLWNRFVEEGDVNEWLASIGARYRLHFPYAPRVQYQHLLFPRLLPVSEWRGGMLADIDLVTLEEAAQFASRHAGVEVSTGDILRASARGQIPLRAVVHRRAKVQKFDGGVYCNRGQDNENVIPKGCIPTLPLTACQQLANTLRASWRTFDGFEEVDGELMRFTKGLLTSDEPDFETSLDDCRVLGADVHALADAFCEAIEEPEAAPSRILANADGTAREGVTTAQVATIFDALPYTAENWPKRLSDTKWLKPAQIALGEVGGATSLWCPATLARLIHGREKGPAKQKTLKALNKRFRNYPDLAPWRSDWDEHYAMFNDADEGH